MGIKITDMTAAESVAGSELLPASVSGSPRSVTPEKIKDYVVDQIEAITAGEAVTGADSVFVLQGGELKPVDLDLVAQHAIDTIWGKAAEADPDGADVLPLHDGGETEKTVTLASLATYVRETIEAAILDVSDLDDGSSTIATTDYLLVTQGTTAKRVQLSDVSSLIYASLATHVTGKTAAGSTDDADVLYMVRGTTPLKVTLEQIADHVNATVSIGGSGIADTLALWSGETTLAPGPFVASSDSGFDTGDNDTLPTTAAVRGELDELINDSDDVDADLEGTDTFLVDDGANGTQRKSALSRILKYVRTAGVYRTLWVPAGAMIPNTTAGAEAKTVEYGTNDMNHDVLAFAGDTADEHAEFDVVMPEAWDRGTIKYKVFWTNGDAAANAGELVAFSLAAGARGDDDALDAVLGAAVEVTDALIADDDLHVTDASAALTVGGTPGLGDLVHFRLSRDYDYDDGGSGTAMDVDAYVLGVLIQYRENLEAAAW